MNSSLTAFLVHLVRLAGIEPTTPWFVAKYSIQLSYSRERQNYSTHSTNFGSPLLNENTFRWQGVLVVTMRDLIRGVHNLSHAAVQWPVLGPQKVYGNFNPTEKFGASGVSPTDTVPTMDMFLLN